MIPPTRRAVPCPGRSGAPGGAGRDHGHGGEIAPGVFPMNARAFEERGRPARAGRRPAVDTTAPVGLDALTDTEDPAAPGQGPSLRGSGVIDLTRPGRAVRDPGLAISAPRSQIEPPGGDETAASALPGRQSHYFSASTATRRASLSTCSRRPAPTSCAASSRGPTFSSRTTARGDGPARPRLWRWRRSIRASSTARSAAWP
jgi:hypothetical protein